jgi:hypothetical protein
VNNGALVFAALITYTIGVNAMSFFNNYVGMNWEWPANRSIKYKIVIEVTELNEVKKLIKSPSFSEDLPEPMSLKGRVLRGEKFNEGVLIELKLPKLELNEVTKGSMAMLGLVNENTVVCIKDMPKDLSDTEERAWLENIDCK